jgi:hypothetical protein
VKTVRGGVWDPTKAPEGSKGTEDTEREARARLARLGTRTSQGYAHGGSTNSTAFLLDIRPAEQRGITRESLIIGRNVLGRRLALADRYDLRVIVFCQEGYTSMGLDKLCGKKS